MNMEEIYSNLLAGVESGSGLRISEGGDMALRLRATAAELSSLWLQVDWLKRQAFPQSAEGEYLNRHAAVRGLERREGTRAAGWISFEIDQALTHRVVVPEGTVCLSLGGLEFLTTQEAGIEAGETSCESFAMAREEGSAGNVPKGSICQMALAPAGIARCVNDEPFAGGSDREDDESLRARVIDSYGRLPNGSNSAYYEAEALNTEGISAARVFPKRRGLGTVDVVVASELGLPSERMLAELSGRFASEREICVDVAVLAPEPVKVDIAAAVEVKTGYREEEVLAEAAAAIRGLFRGGLLGKNLLLAKLGSLIFSVEGVENYVISTPSSDVEIREDQLPVAGTITVTGR